MAAAYPTNIAALSSQNGDVLSEDFMNARDEEIVAIEQSLGAGLVEDIADPLVLHMRVLNTNLSLGHSLGKDVRIGEGSPPHHQVAPLDIVSTNPRVRLNDTTTGGHTYQVRTQDGRFELHRVGVGFNSRVMVAELSQKTDSIHVDAVGKVGIGMDGAGPPTASLDVNGDTIRLRKLKTAAPAPGEGEVGEIRLVADGSDHRIYVKVSGAVWKSGVLS